MTYQGLKDFLDGLSEEQLKMNVTIQHPDMEDEFFMAYITIDPDESDGILDTGHPVICAISFLK